MKHPFALGFAASSAAFALTGIPAGLYLDHTFNQLSAAIREPIDYENTHTTLTMDGKTYTLKFGRKVIEQGNGQTVEYDFGHDTGLQMPRSISFMRSFRDVWLDGIRLDDPTPMDHWHGEEGNQRPGEKSQERLVVTQPMARPDPGDLAQEAGCLIAAHILTLDGKDAPAAYVFNSMVRDAQRFDKVACTPAPDPLPAPAFDQARFG